MDPREQFSVFVTKYALTQGIFQATVEDCGHDMVRDVVARYPTYYHKGEWHRTREGAVAKAEDMRERKIDSVKKQLAGLEKMMF